MFQDVTLGRLLSIGLSTPHRLQLVLRAKLTFPHLQKFDLYVLSLTGVWRFNDKLAGRY